MVARPKLPLEKKRVRVPINVLPEIVEWVDFQVAKGRFFSRTHAFEWAVTRLIEEEAMAQAGGPPESPVDPTLLDSLRGHARISSKAKSAAGRASKTESAKRQ